MKLKEIKVENGYHWIEPMVVTDEELFDIAELQHKVVYYRACIKNNKNAMEIVMYKDKEPTKTYARIDGLRCLYVDIPTSIVGGFV